MAVHTRTGLGMRAGYDRVFERLYMLRDQNRHLRPADFIDLGLCLDALGECVEYLDRLGCVEGKVIQAEVEPIGHLDLPPTLDHPGLENSASSDSRLAGIAG